MKKVLIPVIALLLISCNSNWNAETVKKECIEGVKKSGMDTSNPENMKMTEALCDCSAQKTTAKYKSQTEAEADKKGLEILTMDCLKEYYQNTLPK